MEIIEISRLLDVATVAWPGDAPFELHWTERISDGASVNLSALRLSPHLGTHADAPVHVREGAAGIEACDLSAYLGPARVMTARPGSDGRIPPEALAGIDLRDPPRLLLRTGTHPDSHRWPENFASLAPETAALLVQAGVVLVGLDTPGVDPADSTDLPAHRILADGGLRWLENLDLSAAAPGVYWLVALPLRIRGGDASPVRAVLVRDLE
jgi:arylformamidase